MPSRGSPPVTLSTPICRGTTSTHIVRASTAVRRIAFITRRKRHAEQRQRIRRRAHADHRVGCERGHRRQRSTAYQAAAAAAPARSRARTARLLDQDRARKHRALHREVASQLGARHGIARPRAGLRVVRLLRLRPEPGLQQHVGAGARQLRALRVHDAASARAEQPARDRGGNEESRATRVFMAWRFARGGRGPDQRRSTPAVRQTSGKCSVGPWLGGDRRSSIRCFTPSASVSIDRERELRTAARGVLRARARSARRSSVVRPPDRRLGDARPPQPLVEERPERPPDDRSSSRRRSSRERVAVAMLA